jgi:signal transduction histidine kinase
MSAELPSAVLLVAGGLAAFGLMCLLWALRVTHGERKDSRKWRSEAGRWQATVARMESVFASHPGVILVWEEDAGADPTEWGLPKLYGSPMALAALFRFADASKTPDAAARILDGLGDLEAHDAVGETTTLRRRLIDLRRDGAPFSLTVYGPHGRFLEADGRTAGPRAVLWLTDATIKGMEEQGARGRIEEYRDILTRDPTAFHDIAARAPLPIWRLSGGGKLQWANAAYLRAVEAKHLDSAIDKNALLDPFVTDLSKRALETGDLVDDLRHVVVGGRRRALRLAAFAISGGVAGVSFDETEAEEYRIALERHVKAHDETLNHLDNGVAIFGQDKRLIFHNSAFSRLWQLEESWLRDRPTHGAILDRLRERRRLPARPDFAAWRAHELSLYQETADLPEDLWPLPNGRTLRVARQRHPLGGLLLVFADITDMLTLKTQYQSLLGVHGATLDRLHEAVAVFGSDGRLRLRNKEFARLWGLDDGALSEEASFEDVMLAVRRLSHDADVWKSIKARIADPSPQARTTFQGELPPRSDGLILTYVTHPLPDGATLVAFMDVTAQRQVEDALRSKAEALMATSRLRARLVENVAYHLRTPLTTVKGYAELLDAEVLGPLNTDQKEQVRTILSGAGQLDRLIDNTLDMALVQSGRLELTQEESPARLLLEDAAEQARADAASAGVRIDIVGADDLGMVRVDARRLKQSLAHLLSNAIRFSPANGVVTLAGERVGETMRLCVSDRGPGMDPEIQASMFGALEAGDRQSSGLGLGLALVRAFVEAHGGWVGVTSKRGEGCSVSIHLPCGAAARAPVRSGKPSVVVEARRTAG